MAKMYVVKYRGNIVAGPFVSNGEAQRAQSRLYQESGCLSLSDFEIILE